jgi:hypothetical protein
MMKMVSSEGLVWRCPEPSEAAFDERDHIWISGTRYELGDDGEAFAEQYQMADS